MREIRFSVGSALWQPVTNSWAGWPSAAGVQPYLVLRTVVEGQPDPQTGYVVNITHIDRLLRQRTIPLVDRLSRMGLPSSEKLLRAIADDLRGRELASARWITFTLYVTPHLSYTLYAGGGDAMICLTEMFEFAAAHRLHCPSMSEDENRAYFGKCNNLKGHGHNYQLEVSVAGPIDPITHVVLPPARLEQVVKQRVIDRFDHKHLNEDCAEFRSVNPSVENIARVIWGLLDGQFGTARLAKVRVWETPKTYAEYSGE